MKYFFRILMFVIGLSVMCDVKVSAQDTPENRYLIENAILGYYYTQLCSEQGSLASFEQQKEFERRKFHEQNFEKLADPFSLDFILKLNILNELQGRDIEDYSIMWGDMTDAEYFTLHFDEIKFLYPHIATVQITIDYGVRKVTKLFAMHRWNDRWWINKIAVTIKPLKWAYRYIQEYCDKQFQEWCKQNNIKEIK